MSEVLSAPSWSRLVTRVEPWITFGVALLILLAVRYLVFRWASRRARGTRYGPASVDAFRLPSILWSLAGAVLAAVKYAELSDRQERLAERWFQIFVIASLSLVAAALAVRLVMLYGERHKLPFAVAGLSRTLIYVVMLSIGGTMLLRALAIDITPIVTAFGVGGIGVALALQDTLANFFAGVHILIEAPIGVGDFILLSTGEEGRVTDIGWRTTRLATGANTVVVVPNTKITSGILTNFDLPETRVVADVSVVAGRDADVELLRRIVLEETARAEGVLGQPAPVFLCDPGMLATHLQVKVVFPVANRTVQGAVQSAVRMRILERLRAEGVPLPDVAATLPAATS